MSLHSQFNLPEHTITEKINGNINWTSITLI